MAVYASAEGTIEFIKPMSADQLYALVKNQYPILSSFAEISEKFKLGFDCSDPDNVTHQGYLDEHSSPWFDIDFFKIIAPIVKDGCLLKYEDSESHRYGILFKEGKVYECSVETTYIPHDQPL